MKKLIYFAVVTAACASLMTACNSDKFKKTDNGLKYKFEVINKEGKMPQMGDLLVGELTCKLDTSILFSNVGHPDRIFQVSESMFKGDIQEGLLMMHEGDKATFAIPADSIANFLQPSQMPPMYVKGSGQMFYYEIAIQDIVSKEELAQEEANFIEEMNQRKDNEEALLAEYIANQNITVKPTASGLYIIVNKKGNGPKVEADKVVSMNYTGRLLDGTLFDSSIKEEAEAAGKAQPNRVYEPMTYVVGQQPLIAGWDEGVKGQTEGSEITLVMPSKLGYGARGAGRDILPYSPLVFNITILSVKNAPEAAI